MEITEPLSPFACIWCANIDTWIIIGQIVGQSIGLMANLFSIRVVTPMALISERYNMYMLLYPWTCCTIPESPSFISAERYVLMLCETYQFTQGTIYSKDVWLIPIDCVNIMLIFSTWVTPTCILILSYSVSPTLWALNTSGGGIRRIYT